MFNIQQTDPHQPKYLQLATAIRQSIRGGVLTAGDPLPSVNSISADWGFNRHTVLKSFAELVAEGWIEAKQRVGYRVVNPLPIEHSTKNYSANNDAQPRHAFRLVRKGSALPVFHGQQWTYNFAGGQPDLSRFPYSEFKRHMSAVLQRPDTAQLGYGNVAGAPELVSQIKQYLRKKRAITNREIVITNGSQEALYIIAQLLLEQGDKVAVEALGYPPAMAAFKSAGAQPVAIKQDQQGMLPDDLQRVIQRGNVRLIYLTPLHQYPTTVTLPVSRRMQIYRLAAMHGIPIVEDDYDHEYHYQCQPLAPMAANDPQQLVIYLATFSKIMFPGARIGALALSNAMAEAVCEYRLLINHKNNVLMQLALAKWMDEGGFERHLRRSTRLYQQRRDHAVSQLRGVDCFDFTVPDGGMALWLRIQNDQLSAQKWAEKAIAAGIYLQHETEFHLDPQQSEDRHIRIGYAGMDEHSFSEGLTKLLALK